MRLRARHPENDTTILAARGESSRPAGARSVAIVTLVAAVGLLAGACGATSTSTPQAAATSAPTPTNPVGGMRAGPADTTKPVDGGNLVFGIEAEPEGLDPMKYAFSSSCHQVASAVFDPLATLDQNGNAVPYLATGFEPSDGNMTWTISLPTGVTFHDGSPFDAAAVVKNFEAYQKSLITSAPFKIVASAEVKDPTHVVVKLNRPWTNYPLMLTTQGGYMMSPAMIDNPESKEKPVGTGPFAIDSHVSGKVWSFKKNATYWRKGLPHLDRIDFQPIPDNTERLTKLRSGDVDIIHTYRPIEVNELRSSNFKRIEYSKGDENFLVMNTQAPPFDSLTARQAMATATDSASWTKNVMNGVAEPATSPFAPGQPGADATSNYPAYDLEKAKKLVQQYKAETGNDLEFTFMTQDDVDNQAETQLLTSGYEKAGIKVTVKSIPQINLIATVATGSYQMARFRLFNQWNPDADQHFWYSTSVVPNGVSLNFPRFASPTVDAAIDKALATDDPKVRNEAYSTVAKELGDNVPFIWLGRNVWVLAANERVNGIDAATNGSFQTIGAKTWVADLFLNR